MTNRGTFRPLIFASVALIVLVAVGFVGLDRGHPGNSSDGSALQARLVYAGPAELASAANRGTELPSDLNLQDRYLVFDWQLDGGRVRGKCIYSVDIAGVGQGPNCYRTSQILACNAYQSAATLDGKFETVGLTAGKFHSVDLRSGGRSVVVPSLDGVFVLKTEARVTACRN